jgi:hypothetical protein
MRVRRVRISTFMLNPYAFKNYTKTNQSTEPSARHWGPIDECIRLKFNVRGTSCKGDGLNLLFFDLSTVTFDRVESVSYTGTWLGLYHGKATRRTPRSVYALFYADRHIECNPVFCIAYLPHSSWTCAHCKQNINVFRYKYTVNHYTLHYAYGLEAGNPMPGPVY